MVVRITRSQTQTKNKYSHKELSMKLSVHWKDKVAVREQMARVEKGLAPKGGQEDTE